MTVLELIAKLTLDSSEYEKGLRSAGDTVKSGLGAIAKAGAAAVAASTAAVGAFAATSVKTGATFDKSMAQVAATMGLTMDEMANEVGTVDLAWGTFSGNLRDYAQEMGRNTAFSASQAADALNYMALAGYDTQTSMEMLPNVLNLAAAGNFDLARASDMVTDTQTAFGISLERTSQMVDEMAKAASTGNTSVEQLGDAFLTVGGLAQELNGGMVEISQGVYAPVDGIQELEIALTAMANAGIKGSEAGTHMRNMLLKLSSPTDAGVKQMEALGVSVFDAGGQMRSLSDIFGDLNGALENLTQEQKIQAIADLFNTRDLASAEALLNAVGQDWDKIGSAILDAEGAAQQMAETQLDNLAGDITLFKSALEGAQIAISDQLTPSLRDFVQFGTDGLSKITAAFQEGGLTGAMASFGTILADGLNMIVESAPKFVDAGMQLLGALADGIIDNLPTVISAAGEIAIKLAGGVLKGAPKLATAAGTVLSQFTQGVVSAMPAVMLQGAIIIPNLINGITSALPQLFDSAIQIIDSISSGIRAFLPNLIPVALEAILSFTSTLRENFGSLVDSGIELIMALADSLIEGLPAFIETVPLIVSNIAGLINDNAPKLLTAGIELISKLAMGLIKAIPALLANIGNIVKAIVDVFMAFNWLNLGRQLITLIKNGVQALFTVLPTKLKGIGTQAFNWLKNIDWVGLGRSVITFITNGIHALFNVAPNLLRSIGNTAVNFVKSVDWLGLGKSIINVIVSGVRSLITSIPNAVKSAAEGAISLVQNIDWLGLGKSIIGGIVGGVTSAALDLANSVAEAARSALGAAKNALGINSPSKVFRDEVGEEIPAGIIAGIDRGKRAIKKTMETLSDMMDSEFQIKTPDISTERVNSYDAQTEAQSIQYVQNLTVNSPTPLSPFEVARQTRNANQRVILALNGV